MQLLIECCGQTGDYCQTCSDQPAMSSRAPSAPKVSCLHLSGLRFCERCETQRDVAVDKIYPQRVATSSNFSRLPTGEVICYPQRTSIKPSILMRRIPRFTQVVLQHQPSPTAEERLFAAIEMIFAHCEEEVSNTSESVDRAI